MREQEFRADPDRWGVSGHSVAEQGIYFCTRYRFIPFSLFPRRGHVSPVHLDVNDDVCERFPLLSLDADVEPSLAPL